MVNKLATLLVAGLTLNTVAASPLLRYNPSQTSPIRFDGVKTPVLYASAAQHQGGTPVRRAFGFGKKKSTPAKKPAAKPNAKTPPKAPTKKKSGGGISVSGAIDKFGSAGMGMSGAAGIISAGSSLYSAMRPPEAPPAEAPAEAPVRRAIKVPKKSPLTKKPTTKPTTKPATKPATKRPGGGGSSAFDKIGAAGMGLSGAAGIMDAGSTLYSTLRPAEAAPVEAAPAEAPVRRAFGFGKKKSKPATKPTTKPKKPSGGGGSGFDGYSLGMGMTGVADLVNTGASIYSSMQPAPPAARRSSDNDLYKRAKFRAPKMPKLSGKKSGGLGGFDLSSLGGGSGAGDLINLGTTLLGGQGGMSFQMRRDASDAPLELYEREWDEYIYDELD